MKKTLSLLLIVQLISFFSYATNYYCDPVNGANTNNGLNPGTALSGFSSENSFLSTIITDGDTIFLMEGNHGSVTIQNWIFSTPVVITHYENDNALLGRTILQNCQSLVIDGLEMQTLKETQYSDHVLKVTTCQEVTIQNCHIHSASSITDFSLYEDWWNNMTDGVQIRYGSNNHFYNNLVDYTMFAFVILTSDHNDILGNEISYFGGDGVRVVGSSNTVFSYNYVHDNLSLMPNTGNPLYTDQWGVAQATHQDLLQTFTYIDGQGAGVGNDTTNVYSNNVLIAITDTTRAYKGMAQGMWMGDGTYENILVENNLILTKTYNGIGLAGGNNCMIRNNTILDPYYTIPSHPYSLPQDQNGDLTPIWIILRKHNGVAGIGNEIYNNIVETVNFYQEDFTGQYGTQNNNLILGSIADYGNEFVDPYTNPIVAEGFKLLENSAAVNTGVTSVTLDQDSVIRPQGDGFDIGCFEFEIPIGIQDFISPPECNLYISSGRLNVQINKDMINSVTCYASNGQLIFQETFRLSISKYQKDVSYLPHGVYFLVINESMGVKFAK